MQNTTATTTGTMMSLDLDHAMRINIKRKNIPNYTIPFLSALLSESRHGVAYTGDLIAYLDQIAERHHLPKGDILLKKRWDEVDAEWIETLQKVKSLEVLLAFFNEHIYRASVFRAYLELSAIKGRQAFSEGAKPIQHVICADFCHAVTAFICACEGYQVTQYDFQGQYDEAIFWVFTLLFPQVTVKESMYSIDEEEAKNNLESLLLEEVVDFDRTALVAEDGLLDVRSEALAKKFGYIVNLQSGRGNPLVMNDKIPTQKTEKEQMLALMTEDKKTFVKAGIHIDSYYSIMVIDYQNPSHDVLMLNLDGYEHAMNKNFTDLLIDDDYSTRVNTSTIIANRYHFNASYYAKDSRTKSWLKSLERFDTLELSDLVTFHRPPIIKPVQDEVDEVTLYEVSLSNISEYSHIDRVRKEVTVAKKDALRIKNESLEKGDILFAIKGDIGRVGLIDNNPNYYIAGKGFITLRLKPKAIFNGITPEYLTAYLADEHVKNYIRHLNTGAKVENIRMDDLKSIPVIVDKKFIEKTTFVINALTEQQQKILEERDIYHKLKEGLSQSIAGSGEYLEALPMSTNQVLKSIG